MSVVDLNLEAGKETVAIYVDERGNAIYNITVHQTTCSHLLHNALHSRGLTVRCDCMGPSTLEHTQLSLSVYTCT